jgi:hypothetical protein
MARSTGNNENVNEQLLVMFDQLRRLTALQLIDGKKQIQAIQILNAARFDRNLIAELLNTTPGTVSVTLAKTKAKASPKSRSEEPKPRLALPPGPGE